MNNEYLVTVRNTENGKEVDITIFEDCEESAKKEGIHEYVATYGGYFENIEVIEIEEVQ